MAVAAECQEEVLQAICVVGPRHPSWNCRGRKTGVKQAFDDLDLMCDAVLIRMISPATPPSLSPKDVVIPRRGGGLCPDVYLTAGIDSTAFIVAVKTRPERAPRLVAAAVSRAGRRQG